jgi:hypothetical protein
MGDLQHLALLVRPSVMLGTSAPVASHPSSGPLGWQPNWLVVLVISAVLATLMDKYGGVILYPIRRLKKDQYVKDWYEYHLSYKDGQRILRQSELSIKLGRWSSARRVEFWHLPSDAADGQRKKLLYKGTMRFEKDQLLIEMDAKTHKERLVYRFVNRIPSSDSVVPGIWMSYDHDSHPAAGAAILSGRVMTADEAEKEILRHTNAGAISIK